MKKVPKQVCSLCFLPVLLVILCFSGCKQNSVKETTSNSALAIPRFASAEDILAWMDHPTDDYVVLVAHRGDWRNAPENSIQAIKNCLDMGVEIVEIDVRMSKDQHLVVLHDTTLDRTTTGTGLVNDWPLDSLQTLNLKNGANIKTGHKIPTLEAALELIKDKPILLNLDKVGNHLPQTFELLKKTGTLRQCIFKGNESIQLMKRKFGAIMDSIIYMPMIWPGNYTFYDRDTIIPPTEYAKEFINTIDPIAFEVIYSKENSPTFDAIQVIKEHDIPVWVNTLWAELCAGHHDDAAIHDPDGSWGWVIENGANIIQTDRPGALIAYLEGKGLR